MHNRYAVQAELYLIQSNWTGFCVNLIRNLNKYMIWGMQNNIRRTWTVFVVCNIHIYIYVSMWYTCAPYEGLLNSC